MRAWDRPAAIASTRGIIVCPTIPSRAVIPTARSVKPTTHGLRLCVASEIAPKTGIEMTTSSEDMLLATAAMVFDAPTSSMSHTAKNSVAMFIEKMVLEKS